MNSYLENIIGEAVKKAKNKKPQKKKTDVDEIVDVDGNIMNSKIPADVGVKTITSKKTTDDVIAATHCRPATDNGGTPTISRRYWGETDMSKTLGYDETMGDDKPYDDAKQYFEKELEFDTPEAEERLKKMGYNKKQKDKIRLIEKSEIEEMVDSILAKRTSARDITNKSVTPEINPLLKRQLASLKDNLAANNLTIKDVINFFNE